MTGGLAFWSIRAIGAADLTGIAHIEVDMWVILRRLIPNALELAAANAHDRHPDFIIKLRITFHPQRAAYRRFPRILDALTIVRPETIVRWHRKGFAALWRWKSRPLGGRPRIDKEVRDLIRRMSFENPLWGAPHIHGELLKLGFEVAQSTVSTYMTQRPDPSSQGWGTFLRNHGPNIAAMDLFVVPTIGFNLLYVLVIVRLARRELV